MKSLVKLVESEVKPMSSGEVMHLPIEALSTGEKLTTYSLARWMKDRLEKRMELLRLSLLDDSSKIGAETENGGRKFELNGSTVRVDKKIAKLPDEEKFKTLLAVNGIEESAVYDKVTTTVLNPSKIQALIETGKLDGPAVDALKKVSFALTVGASGEIESLTEAAFASFNAEKQAVVEGAAFGAAVLAADAKTQKPKKKKAGA